MTDVEPVVTDFAATGRAGRRNALPDILGSPAGTGTADLPDKLSELSVSGKYEAASSRETELTQTGFCSQMLCIQYRIQYTICFKLFMYSAKNVIMCVQMYN
ncbi:IPKB inhibitor, partial [Atractosteus spatula]|nr:IPKB inhibitor [Atractosteus spatula]